MAAKRSLYEILGVPRKASRAAIREAHEERLKKLDAEATPQAAAEKALVRDAFDVLIDPDTRMKYDERLRQEALRALASGGGGQPPAEPEPAKIVVERSRWPLVAGLCAAVIVVGALWKYFDEKKQAAAIRAERERMQLEQERLEREAAASARETSAAAAAAAQAGREAEEQRQWTLQREREQSAWRRQQEQQARQEEWDRQRAAAEQRQAEYAAQQREEMERSRAREQLEREKQFLRERGVEP